MSHEHDITSALDNAKQRCAVRVSHRVCYTNLILVMRLTYPARRARCQELSLERVAKNILSSAIERSFSVQNLNVTALRNRLSAQTCDRVMRVNLIVS